MCIWYIMNIMDLNHSLKTLSILSSPIDIKLNSFLAVSSILFMPRDIPGVWPMARHYFFFGPKPPATGQYNPLQKLAYTSTIGFGVLSLLTGIVLYKPAQFSWLAFLFGGFHLTRVWHFAGMCGFLAFIPGHLIMVLLHGWSNFLSMLSGWKREPEYQDRTRCQVSGSGLRKKGSRTRTSPEPGTVLIV